MRTVSGSGSRVTASPARVWPPPGDRYVVVRVDQHPFSADAAEPDPDRPLTFPEAALGTTVTVPTLHEPVTVRIPAGTASGTTLRVRGRVSQRAPQWRPRPGICMVKIDVVVPDRAERGATGGGRVAGRGDRRGAAPEPRGLIGGASLPTGRGAGEGWADDSLRCT